MLLLRLTRTFISTLLLTALLFIQPGKVGAEERRFVTGLTLSSIGATGAVVAGFGSLAYISNLEHAGGWAWLSLASGGLTMAGGIILANSRDSATAGGISALITGILSISIGAAGLTLQSPESKRRTWLFRPQLATAPSGQLVPMFGVDGVF
jgi:hypothetical protein